MSFGRFSNVIFIPLLAFSIAFLHAAPPTNDNFDSPEMLSGFPLSAAQFLFCKS
jgi:hypothetical protein